MAGWGLCGVMGAALALGARNAGRFTLAAVCGFAGIAYGVLLNFSLMATYGGDLSLERFLALEARAIPFDAAHAIGNVAFALLAGPAMVRMLVRFRERFEWRTPAVATAVLDRAAAAAGARAQSRASAADAGSAASWLESAQNADGGFGASARGRLQRRDHRLGDAGPRGGRPQPARRRPPSARRRSTSCAPTSTK